MNPNSAVEQRPTKQWQSSDHRHYLHPFTDHKELGEQGSRIITRANGIYIWDSDGHKILDGMAGLWCVNLGYGRQELIDAATARVFFTGSGSEANDTQIRLIRRYWDLQGQPERMTIIARKNAYHGSTVAAASLGGMEDMHKQLRLPVPGIVHIEQPYHFGLGQGQDPDAFGIAQARLLEEKILELGADKVAAFFAEPVQGAGGVIIPPESYWPEIQKICDQYGILLVADEVITGFGRLGEWFASSHYDIKPDLISFAKGVSSGYLPLGGALVGDRVADVIIAQGGEFAHGFTYSGHPAACAVALTNIRILRDEGIIGRVKNEIAPWFNERWSSLNDHPLVGEARSLGLMGALELVASKSDNGRFDKALGAGAICRNACMASGLIMRAVGDTMIVSPPLVISKEQVDELIEKATQALDQTASELGVA